MYLLTEWEGRTGKYLARPNWVNKHFIIWLPLFHSFFFFLRVIKFAIGVFTHVAHFDRKVGIYIATKLLQFASRKELHAILAGPDGFFRPCSRHRVQPSYGDFLNSFAMKARAGPYGSYDNYPNHKNYNFFFTISIVIGLKNSYFPLIHLPSCYRTVCYRTACYRTVCYRTVQQTKHIQSCSLNQPITFKVVV